MEEVEDNLYTQNFDKLKGLSNEDSLFNFLCPECQSENIRLVPLGISVRPEDNDNKDFETNEQLRKHMIYLNNLPTLRQAIRNSKKEDLMYVCDTCNSCSFIPKELDKTKLNMWLKKTMGVEGISLGSRV